ncbi:MAG TPA: lysophospholipid acyltransferase family protein [Candidatus Dormibacteraeota bacterium]|jgi:1-acyl-sn-glycerol-3-phosphate acyltransferase
MAARLTVSPPPSEFPVRPRATPAARAVRRLFRGVGRGLFDVEVRGLENLRAGENHVIIANHLQWVDAFAVVSALPPQPRIHVFGDLVGVPVWAVRLVKRIGGVIPIDRREGGSSAVLDHAEACLVAGGSLLIFPEGRCNQVEGAAGEFRKGFAHFALHTGTPVLPVGLSGTRELWLRKRLTVAVGEPITSAGHTAESLTAAGRDAVLELLAEPAESGGRHLLQRRLTHLF